MNFLVKSIKQCQRNYSLRFVRPSKPKMGRLLNCNNVSKSARLKVIATGPAASVGMELDNLKTR